MEQRKSLMRNQEGFTLIEIIAVLVLLGILAAVAVPKYFDMQTQARDKAANAAVAEGLSLVNQAAARYILLNNGSVPTKLEDLTTATTADPPGGGLPDTSSAELDLGDFTIKFESKTGETSTIVVTATGKDGTTVAEGTAKGEVKLPTKIQ